MRAVIGVGLAVLAAGCRSSAGEPTRFYADVQDTAGIHPGAPLYNQVRRLGSVQAVTVQNGRGRLTIAFDSVGLDTAVRAGDRVALQPGHLGVGAVTIVPGPRSAAPLAEGAILIEFPPEEAARARRAAHAAVQRALDSALRAQARASAK